MLININGNIIDTEKIWNITPIQIGYNKQDEDDVKSYFVETSLEGAYWVQFRIISLEKKKEIVIERNLRNGGTIFTKVPLEVKQRILDDFTTSYNLLLVCWNKSSSPIPEIKF